MKLQIIGSPHSEVNIVTNLREFLEEILKNKVEKTNSIKLLGCTISQSGYKNIGFMNYKVKNPDFIIIRGLTTSMIEAHILNFSDFNYAKVIEDNSSIYLINKEKYLYKGEFSTYYYSYLEYLSKWVYEYKDLDSANLVLEDEVINQYEDGEEITETVKDILIKCKNPVTITNLLNLYDMRGQGYWLYNVIRHYLNKRIVLGRNIYKKYKIYERGYSK